MDTARYLIPTATGILGIVFGLLLSPIVHRSDGATNTQTSTKFSKTSHLSEPISTTYRADAKINHRTRARERDDEKKPKEPRISIPVAALAEGLRKTTFTYSSEFDDLSFSMEKALVMLGATNREKEDLIALVKKSKTAILEAEKSYVKLAEVGADNIQLDMSAMRGPAAEIAEQMKDGIRTTLPSDIAGTLISAINWDKYYPTDEKSFVRLDITRGRQGKLMAWVRHHSGSSGTGVKSEFKDDGTPLPADQIFEARWKPFLKGVTILPKDEP